MVRYTTSAGERWWWDGEAQRTGGLEVGTLPADRSALPLYHVVDIVPALPRAFPKIDIGAYQPAVINVFPIAVESWYLSGGPGQVSTTIDILYSPWVNQR